ncbi:MAG: TRAP transporter small permease subunit [Burkholderiales bacterium]|nr:TRAP transporter small permease subunit [Burkholderiales bacterium]
MVPPRRWDRFVERFGEAASYLFIAVVAISAYEVVMRYAVGAPTIWVHELAVALAATCFVIGGPLVHQRRQHVTISFVYDRMGPRTQRVASVLGSLLTLAFCLLLTYASARQALIALRAGETTGTAINWPIPAYLKTLFAIAAAVMVVQSAAHLVTDLRRLRARH